MALILNLTHFSNFVVGFGFCLFFCFSLINLCFVAVYLIINQQEETLFIVALRFAQKNRHTQLKPKTNIVSFGLLQSGYIKKLQKKVQNY